MSEFNSAYMQINTGGGTYQDSYLRVKSLSDGKGGGIGGHWGGNDFTDTISNSGARGRSRMYSGKQRKIIESKNIFSFLHLFHCSHLSKLFFCLFYLYSFFCLFFFFSFFFFFVFFVFSFYILQVLFTTSIVLHLLLNLIGVNVVRLTRVVLKMDVVIY